VRIPEDWLPRIDRAAAKLGTNRARLIAFCAQTFAENFERTGVASMPPNWEEIFQSMDGRTSKAQPVRYPAIKSGAVMMNEPSSAKTQEEKFADSIEAEAERRMKKAAGNNPPKRKPRPAS
jgi:hypothetical protein